MSLTLSITKFVDHQVLLWATKFFNLVVHLDHQAVPSRLQHWHNDTWGRVHLASSIVTRSGTDARMCLEFRLRPMSQRDACLSYDRRLSYEPRSSMAKNKRSHFWLKYTKTRGRCNSDWERIVVWKSSPAYRIQQHCVSPYSLGYAREGAKIEPQISGVWCVCVCVCV